LRQIDAATKATALDQAIAGLLADGVDAGLIEAAGCHGIDDEGLAYGVSVVLAARIKTDPFILTAARRYPPLLRRPVARFLDARGAPGKAKAAREATEHLSQYGWTWVDVALRTQPAWQPPSPAGPPAWRAIATACLARADRFSEREREFLADMQHWRGAPSERQAAWLERLHARLLAASAPAIAAR
jgi:hypothetical protein